MRFFVPAANDSRQAEQRYRDLYDKAGDRLGPVSSRRIYRLKFSSEENALNIAVGDSFHLLGSEPVVAILENEKGFYVYTPTHGAVEGEPFHVDKSKALAVEEFTTLA